MSKSRAYDPPQWAAANRAKPRRATWDDFAPPLEQHQDWPPVDGDPTIIADPKLLARLTELHRIEANTPPPAPRRAGPAVFDRSKQKAAEDARWKAFMEADRGDDDRWAS